MLRVAERSLTLLLDVKFVMCLGRYSVDNVPCMVAVSLKRFDEQLLKIESQVDFPSQLHLHKYGTTSSSPLLPLCSPQNNRSRSDFFVESPACRLTGAIFLWSLLHVA